MRLVLKYSSPFGLRVVLNFSILFRLVRSFSISVVSFERFAPCVLKFPIFFRSLFFLSPLISLVPLGFPPSLDFFFSLSLSISPSLSVFPFVALFLLPGGAQPAPGEAPAARGAGRPAASHPLGCSGKSAGFSSVQRNRQGASEGSSWQIIPDTCLPVPPKPHPVLAGLMSRDLTRVSQLRTG